MLTLNEFLKSSDLYLTLANEEGESFAAGKADYVKPLSSKTIIRWHTDGKYGNIHPFTYAILHGLKEIFSINTVKPFRFDRETTVEMVY